VKKDIKQCLISFKKRRDTVN